MKYDSGGAFRRALEKRLRDRSVQSGIALDRLRKMVAFDRFLARLIQGQPGQWVLKGGVALQRRRDQPGVWLQQRQWLAVRRGRPGSAIPGEQGQRMAL